MNFLVIHLNFKIGKSIELNLFSFPHFREPDFYEYVFNRGGGAGLAVERAVTLSKMAEW